MSERLGFRKLRKTNKTSAKFDFEKKKARKKKIKISLKTKLSPGKFFQSRARDSTPRFVHPSVGWMVGRSHFIIFIRFIPT